MSSTFPRDGIRPRARRLLSRLAAALVVGSLGLGVAPAAGADDADAEQPTDPAVQLLLSVGAAGEIAPDTALLGTVTIDNPTDCDLSAGSVSIELNTTTSSGCA